MIAAFCCHHHHHLHSIWPPETQSSYLWYWQVLTNPLRIKMTTNFLLSYYTALARCERRWTKTCKKAMKISQIGKRRVASSCENNKGLVSLAWPLASPASQQHNVFPENDCDTLRAPRAVGNGMSLRTSHEITLANSASTPKISWYVDRCAWDLIMLVFGDQLLETWCNESVLQSLIKDALQVQGTGNKSVGYRISVLSGCWSQCEMRCMKKQKTCKMNGNEVFGLSMEQCRNWLRQWYEREGKRMTGVSVLCGISIEILHRKRHAHKLR